MRILGLTNGPIGPSILIPKAVETLSAHAVEARGGAGLDSAWRALGRHDWDARLRGGDRVSNGDPVTQGWCNYRDFQPSLFVGARLGAWQL